MSNPQINGGFYIKARIIQESDIMRQPPHVREIWDYLLMQANHSDQKYNGFVIKRGQCFRTYKDIREGLAWFVGWRKQMYNENQTKKAMKFLREALMVTTRKEPGGVLITICNYDTYQDPKNYERTSERTNERTIEEPLKNQPLPDTNKNEKNIKNDNKKKENIKRKKYGEYKHVLLQDDEFERLLSEWGTEKLNRMIKELDEGIELKGYKYKNYNLALRKWEGNQNGNNGSKKTGRDVYIEHGKKRLDV